jgi:hypothetical protein
MFCGQPASLQGFVTPYVTPHVTLAAPLLGTCDPCTPRPVENAFVEYLLYTA